ncbi:VOC family protein [Paenibacillus alkalitolerans]|uniref:VOC family protein n=1 Tax=Paenibacillus alkalitolerans TaxID=2799335 RepID=UPI0018F56B2C|nr:VOC family protein [Paenibacillus alkalitolerans]
MSHKFYGIDHVLLAAPEGCEPTARSFFGGLLGWVEIPKPETLRKRGGVWFQCGAHQVHIGVQEDFIPASKAHPAFLVHNIESLREHLLQSNIQVIHDEERTEEGVKRFFLKDPFGNRLEFLEWVLNRPGFARN